jgi:ABC-type amino acid transport substrate-binding protein
MTFITGGAVVSRNSQAINSLEDLDGKNIAVIGGTTTEDALRKFIQLNEVNTRLTMIRTHDEGMQLLEGKKINGYASDRAMLIGQVFRSADASEYALTRSVFSFEPYSMMVLRGDTQFRLAADRALASLYRTARIRRVYQKWFGRYGEPLSPIVEAMYEFQAVGE